MGKKRITVPPDVSARTLFLSDRTCCVCRKKEKPVQIHHIDGDTTNNSPNNLAVLCLDCHNQTQLSGGFGRGLDAEQVILYRDDWLRLVENNRSDTYNYKVVREINTMPLEYVTSLAEIYRDSNQYGFLAMLYDRIGNKELRDKYIEKRLEKNPSDSAIIFYRSLQRRIDLVPKDTINRTIERHQKTEDWTELARVYINISDYEKAAKSYVKGITRAFEEKRVFSAAFYLKEIVEEQLIEKLFEISFREAAAKGELWWQVRSLQELGWQSELRELLIRNKERIKKGKNDALKALLAKAAGDENEFFRLMKEIESSEDEAVYDD